MMKCPLGVRPGSDDGYFKEMTRAVFRSGFSWKVIDNKWPEFRSAFADFSIGAVSEYDDPDIDRLMENRGIVRNYRKVLAAIKNARELLSIRREYGSFAGYLGEIGRNGEEELCKALSKRFSHLGKSTSFFFLRSVGEEMPETSRKWVDEHTM